MRQMYFFQSIRKTTIQFFNTFTDIKVGKYKKDTNGDISLIKTINVPLRMTPKDKFIYWIKDQRLFEQRVPIIGASMTGISYDAERKQNRNAPITYSSNNKYQTYLNPTPYNISYRLTLASQYLIEMDQMLEQIAPFYDPYTMIKIALPELDTIYEVKAILTSISPGGTVDMPQEKNRIITWDLDFTLNAWVFRPISDTGIIKEIIQRFYMNEDAFSAMREIDPNITDSYPISANHDFDTETVVLMSSQGASGNINIEEVVYEGN